MVQVAETSSPRWRALLLDSGEPRRRPSARTGLVTTALSVWFVVGLMLDAWAHANVPRLETFFTPWHAVFYSGFAATALWVLWIVWREIQDGRRGLSAVPVGYGMTVVALPVFALSGGIDLLWHTLLGIERNLDIFFSPSHLGLITSMVVILTSPLRSVWSDPELAARPSPRRLLPAVGTLGFAATLVLLFLPYGNGLRRTATSYVDAFSPAQDARASSLAAQIAMTTLVLLAPPLVIARRWGLPFGTATIGYAAAAVLSGALTGFGNLSTLLSVLLAGLAVDLLGRWLRPSGSRRAGYWAFAAASGLLTWVIVLGTASAVAGRLPAITELWTGAPIVAGLLGWLLAALLLPNAEPGPAPAR